MPIAYDIPSNTITVTGFTLAVPCTFLDIFNADVAGGWGVVTRQCVNQYCFDCKLVIGNGTFANRGYFADEDCMVSFLNGVITANGQTLIYVRRYSDFRLGVLLDAATRTCDNGVTVISDQAFWYYYIYGYLDTVVRLYDTTIKAIGAWSNRLYLRDATCDWHLYECSLDQVYLYVPSRLGVLYRTEIKSTAYGIYHPRTGITVDDLLLHHCADAIRFSAALNGILWNVIGRLNTDIVYSVGITVDCYLINADVDVWNVTWAGVCTAEVYRQYEFDCVIRDRVTGGALVGATVILWDNAGNLVFTVVTGAGGVIATQIVSHGYFDQPNLSVEQLYSPFHLRVEMPGYKTYDDYNGVALDMKTALEISLCRIVDLIFVDDKMALNLDEDNPESELYTQI